MVTPQRAVSLAAWRLLEVGMRHCGYHDFQLADVVHPEDAKPYWSGAGARLDAHVDFSISHARGIAACAIGHGVVVGCDAEERQRIQRHLTQRLVRADAVRFPCWTELEAVVKAAGLGIMHGNEIQWTAHAAFLDGRSWWCYPIASGPLHAAHVAADAANLSLQVTQVVDL